MNVEEFKRILNEMFEGNVIYIDEPSRYAPHRSIIVEVSKNEYSSYRYFPKTTLAVITANNSTIGAVGFEKGKVAITLSPSFISEASNNEIYSVIAIVPMVISDFAKKVALDESDQLEGIARILELQDKARDTTAPTRRVLYKSANKLATRMDKNAYKKGFVDAIKTYEKLLRGGWKIIEWQGEKALYYEGRIEVDVIRKDGNYYIIPPEKRGKLYAEGIIVPLRGRIEYIYAKKHHHPNIDNNGSMCLGEGRGVPLSDIMTVISLIRTANLDSPFGGSPQITANTILNSILDKKAITLTFDD